MLNSKKLFFLTLFGMSIGQILPFSSLQAGTPNAGTSLPPGPPAQNPHPPMTVADKNRVSFAEEMVNLFLKKKPAALASFKHQKLLVHPPYQNKDVNCVIEPSCYVKDYTFMDQLDSIHTTHGLLTEARFAHVIPWSFEQFEKNSRNLNKIRANETKPSLEDRDQIVDTAKPRLQSDEYMIHVYVKFEKADYWHHLDIILSEDEKGKLYLRGFFVVPMRSERMPDVEC